MGKNLIKCLGRKILPLVLSTSIFFGIGACAFEPKKPKEDIFTETTLGAGYERPGGLSSYHNQEAQSQFRFQIQSEARGFQIQALGTLSEINPQIFAERPTFVMEIGYDTSRTSFLKKPSVRKVSGTLEEKLYEFQDTDIDEFMWGGGNILYFDAQGNEFYRPRGLILDTAILGDGSILLSTTASKKLFRIHDDDNDNIFEKEIYKEDGELAIITDIMRGGDGKIYAALAPLYDVTLNEQKLIESFSLIRPKKVISIDPINKDIKTEFEIPDIDTPLYWRLVPHGTYRNYYFQLMDQIKIAENSPNGKLANGIDFYISDLTEKRIYQASKNPTTGIYDVRVFKELEKPPVSINVDNEGSLFVITTAILDFSYEKKVVFAPELLKITPDGLESLVHTFDVSNLDLTNESIDDRPITILDQLYRYAGIYLISSTLLEDSTNYEFYVSFSHPGELKVLTATKK